MKTTLKILLFVLLGFFSIANAQNELNEINAFSESYKYEKSKSYDKAIDAIEKLYNEKSYAHNLRLGWLHYLKGNHSKSSTYYEKAIKINPNSIEAKLGYTYPLGKLKNYNEMYKQYKNILGIEPNNTTANYWLAYSNYIQKKYDVAEKYVNRILKLYPFDYDANDLAGWIALKSGNKSKAKTYFFEALRIYPNNKSSLAGLKELQ